MSLFSSIQLANNSLIAAQLGLQVAGNNIANAHTEGYLRQDLIVQPAPTQRVGDILLGTGVDVVGVIQRVDKFLERRLRGSTSELAQGEAHEAAYRELEALVGELNDNDLSSSLTEFFSSIHDIANQPESISVRNLAVLKGKSVAGDIQNLSDRVREAQTDADERIRGLVKEVNILLEQLARLNVQIVTAEGGDTTESDAVGLRDKRLLAITRLAEIMNIRAEEQADGSTAIYAGSDVLVFAGTFNEVTSTTQNGIYVPRTEIRIARTDSPLFAESGKLAGLYHARDEILGGFHEDLDNFSAALVYEFNKVFSSGQGLKGYTDLTSEHAVADPSDALDQTGLAFTPVNGSFQVQVVNNQTGVRETHDLFVQLSGLSTDTSANDLAAAINAIDGVTASVDSQGYLQLNSESPVFEFSFADDTSGVLAALGLNTFFSGSTANSIGVSQVIQADAGKFAASRGGPGEDSANVEILADFQNRPLGEHNGASLAILYDQLVGETTQDAAVARSFADGLRIFQKTLEGQKFATSGVSIDEEAIRMIKYQRVYQASARYIQSVTDLLEVLVNL